MINGGRLVATGSRVTAGQMIARTGSTGASTGCHLHFAIRKTGIAIDPAAFLRKRGIFLLAGHGADPHVFKVVEGVSQAMLGLVRDPFGR